MNAWGTCWFSTNSICFLAKSLFLSCAFQIPFPDPDLMPFCTAHSAGNSCLLLLKHQLIASFLVKFLSQILLLLPNHAVLSSLNTCFGFCIFYLLVLGSIKNRLQDYPDESKKETRENSYYGHIEKFTNILEKLNAIILKLFYVHCTIYSIFARKKTNLLTCLQYSLELLLYLNTWMDFLNSVITKNEAGFWGGAEMGLLYNSRVILGHNFKNYSQMRCKKFK